MEKREVYQTTREVYAVLQKRNSGDFNAAAFPPTGTISTEVVITLDSLLPTDYYATNLELTGSANWFGSRNMCNMMAAESAEIFRSTGAGTGLSYSGTQVTHDDPNILPPHTPPIRVLELGSGMGRAGITARLVMKELNYHSTGRSGRSEDTCNEGTTCVVVMTEGEASLLEPLRRNCMQNGLSLGSEVQCRQLWWGKNEQLDLLSQEYVTGFDVILGADLVYGPQAEERVRKLFHTVSTLLAPASATVVQSIATGADITVDKTVKASTVGTGTTTTDKGNTSTTPPTTVAAVSAKFYLAFTRRDALSPEALLDIADSFGLESYMHEDYTFDIFDNNVDGSSMFWRDTIYVFSRKQQQ